MAGTGDRKARLTERMIDGLRAGERDEVWWDTDQRGFAVRALLSAVCGRHYNTPTGLGLNTYIAVVSETGTGKGIMEKGIMALMSSVEKLFAFRVYVRF